MLLAPSKIFLSVSLKSLPIKISINWPFFSMRRYYPIKDKKLIGKEFFQIQVSSIIIRSIFWSKRYCYRQSFILEILISFYEAILITPFNIWFVCRVHKEYHTLFFLISLFTSSMNRFCSAFVLEDPDFVHSWDSLDHNLEH